VTWTILTKSFRKDKVVESEVGGKKVKVSKDKKEVIENSKEK